MLGTANGNKRMRQVIANIFAQSFIQMNETVTLLDLGLTEGYFTLPLKLLALQGCF